MEPSSARASSSAASARTSSPSASADETCSSVRPSRPNTSCTERPTSRTGLSGKASALIASATLPPTSASIRRVGGKAVPLGSSTTSRIAETAASVTSSGPPPSATAADMARITITPSCSGPGADCRDQQVGHPDAEHHSADQLDGTLAALPVRGPDRDHRRDRGEHRPLAGQDQLGQVPRSHDREGGLQDRPGARAKAKERVPRPRGLDGDVHHGIVHRRRTGAVAGGTAEPAAYLERRPPSVRPRSRSPN